MSSPASSVLDIIGRRMDLQRALRDFFGQRQFVEVETPVLIAANAPELHIEALAAPPTATRGRSNLYFRTSPELALKGLLAQGAQRVFEIARVARDEAADPAHRLEFTLLEWYRAGSPYQDLMTDCEELLAHCVAALGCAPVSRLGAGRCRLDAGCDRLTVVEAFARFADIDLLPLLDAQSSGSALAREARAHGLTLPPGLREGDDPPFDDVFFSIFLTAIEPHLGRERPTLVYAWPASMAALARRDPRDPRLALRFELYAAGLELANAFDELTDVEEQRRRFDDARQARQAQGLDPYPMPERFLTDLQTMPPSAGIALGFERLLMLLFSLDDMSQAAIPGVF